MNDQVSEISDGGVTDAAALVEVLKRLRTLRDEDVFVNPVMLMGLWLKRADDRGALDEAGVDRVVRELTAIACEMRSTRLGHYLGERDPDQNRKTIRHLIEGLPKAREAFARIVESPRFGFVFTAHPTFSLRQELQLPLIELALGFDDQGAPVSDERRRSLMAGLAGQAHGPDHPLDLETEYSQSLQAVQNLHHGLNEAQRILFEVARERFPDNWRELRPRLVTIASWVGYDLDGRSDITWNTSFAKRLRMKRAQLQRAATAAKTLIERSSGEPRVSQILQLVEARAALASTRVAEDLATFESPASKDAGWASELAVTSRQMVEGGDGRLHRVSELTDLIDQALAVAEDEDLALELALFRSELLTTGLARAQTHLRLNAIQLHNAVRQLIAMDHPPDDPAHRLSYMERIHDLIQGAAPAKVHFGSVHGERATARRMMMLIAQFLKYVDEDEPVRLLIAETETAFTLLAALYLAKLFGVDDRIDISPLFETERALDRGVAVIANALAQPAYRDYVIRRGRLCVQTGFSDAGRYLGQTAAAVSIEKLRLGLAEVMSQKDLEQVELVIFDTHGESIGRGCHPESFFDRLAYVDTAEARRRYWTADIQHKQEMSFQGGDGYLPFLVKPGALAVLTRVLEHRFEEPRAVPDPFYAEATYVQEFFTGIKRFNAELIDNPCYATLLGVFGTNLLPPMGSRSSKRQYDATAFVDLEHPSQLRAIPHNTILQQLGFLANTIGGVGRAIARDPDKFSVLYHTSDRFRRIIAMVEHAFKYTDPAVLKAYIDLFDPALWQLRAARQDDLERQEHLRAVAALMEQINIHDRLSRVFRVLHNDYLDLSHWFWHHRRARKDAGEEPIAIDDRTRNNMHLLNAVRLALMQRILLKAVNVPDFSGRHELTREDVLVRMAHLDVDVALNLLRQIFPRSEAEPIESLDFGEIATYEGGGNQSYANEHNELFDPIQRLFAQTQRLGGGLIHHIGAVG